MRSEAKTSIDGEVRILLEEYGSAWRTDQFDGRRCVALRSLSLAPQQHADERELEQRGEHEQHARRAPDVHRHQVRDEEVVRRRRGDGGHRQYGGDAERDARRVRVAADPEADPRDDDDEDRRHVRLQDEVADVAPQSEHRRQTRVLAFTRPATLH